MNKYLFFRTDRIGDFIVTLILVNSIKRHDQNSKIIFIGSKKNYHFIKKIKLIDEVYLYPQSSLIGKIKLIKYLNDENLDYITPEGLPINNGVLQLNEDWLKDAKGITLPEAPLRITALASS